MLENQPGSINDHCLASYAAWISLARPLHEQNILDTELLTRYLLSHFNTLRASQKESSAGLRTAMSAILKYTTTSPRGGTARKGITSSRSTPVCKPTALLNHTQPDGLALPPYS